jgi:superfamily I DNA/RNA helicase
VFDRSPYLRAAEELRQNDKQWQAYESAGHCILLAGPGSGKTKTLTVKLARMLSEDIEEPRGLACITFSNECALELQTRLQALGVNPGKRVFIGTVHSFSLTQIILPYASTARLDLPDDFAVATQAQAHGAFERAFQAVMGGSGRLPETRLSMDRYRRRLLDRTRSEWRTADPIMCRLVEAYEFELRELGLIDFDDMPLLAVRALAQNAWLQKALVAKYPVLAIDEYQDLGFALHRMVLGLCFSAGMRLFAVGDVDQSIYGFTGAYPELLRRLSEREDVETIRLGLNYRCGVDIVAASEYALGETRGYSAPTGAHKGTIFFHPSSGSYTSQAHHLIHSLIPTIQARRPGLDTGKIAVLYPAAFIGDHIRDVATAAGYSVIRTDSNALYPRGSRLLRWLEQCAMWCCGGWQSGQPRFSRVVSEGARLFNEVLTSDDARLGFQRNLIASLWSNRDNTLSLHDWLSSLRRDVIAPLASGARGLNEEMAIMGDFIARLSPAGDIVDFTIGEFAGIGSGVGYLNLSTLHSAKGREFDVVILFGVDEGRLPRRNSSPNDIQEARRLFYVGFTRARHEVHLMFSEPNRSRFLSEIESRLTDA